MKNIISLAIILISAPAAAAPLSAPKEASANIFIDFKIADTPQNFGFFFFKEMFCCTNITNGFFLLKQIMFDHTLLMFKIIQLIEQDAFLFFKVAE